MKTEIFGISTDERLNVNDKFDCVYDDDDEVIYVSKELFHHEEDNDSLNFDYRYAIQGVYCEGDWFYELALVVMPNSMHEEVKNDIKDFCGVENDEDITISDILATGGCSVTFGSTTTKGETCDYEVFDKVATIFETMNSLRGFYIDKAWNMIGTTGWDTLNHAVHNEKLFKF